MNWNLIFGIALGAAVATAPGARASDLEVGDPAPPFELAGSDGRQYSLEQFRGDKAVVVAWFPKAFTGG